MCIAKDWFARHWRLVCGLALLSFGPLAVAANLLAQQVPFNAIFLVSDPNQKWRLLANFLLYFTPFLAGAAFLGSVFLKARTRFNRAYFADLLGSGLCGLVVLLRHVCFRAAGPDPRAADPVAHGGWLLVHGRRGPARADRPHRRGRRHLRRASLACTGARSLEARRLRLQGRRLCAEIPRFAARLCEELAVRLSRNLCELLSAFRAGSFRQRRLQPEELPRQCL